MKTRIFCQLLFIGLINFTPYAQLRPASDLAGGYNFSVPEIYHTQRIKQEFLKQMIKELKINPEDLKGSPYLIDTYLPGLIADDLTGKSVNVHIRYNIYNDIFEVKYDPASDEVYGFLKNAGYHAKLGDKKFYFMPYTDKKNKTKEGYLEELLHNTSIILYKKHYQKLHMPKPAKTSLEVDVPGKLTNHSIYFIKIDEQLIRLNSNKKKIYKDFPKHKELVRKYINDKKLKLKEDQEFIQLVKYYLKL